MSVCQSFSGSWNVFRKWRLCPLFRPWPLVSHPSVLMSDSDEIQSRGVATNSQLCTDCLAVGVWFSAPLPHRPAFEYWNQGALWTKGWFKWDGGNYCSVGGPRPPICYGNVMTGSSYVLMMKRDMDIFRVCLVYLSISKEGGFFVIFCFTFSLET